MSDKDRRKKDGENKDKKNQRMREAVSERAQDNPTERQRQKHEAKLTDTVPEGEARMKKRLREAGAGRQEAAGRPARLCTKSQL